MSWCANKYDFANYSKLWIQLSSFTKLWKPNRPIFELFYIVSYNTVWAKRTICLAEDQNLSPTARVVADRPAPFGAYCTCFWRASQFHPTTNTLTPSQPLPTRSKKTSHHISMVVFAGSVTLFVQLAHVIITCFIRSFPARTITPSHALWTDSRVTAGLPT